MPCLYKPTGGENKDGHWEEGCRRPSPSCPANTTIQAIDLVLKINKKKVIKLILMVSIISNSQIHLYSKNRNKSWTPLVKQLVIGTPGRVMTRAALWLADNTYPVLAQVSVPQPLAISTEGVRRSGGVGVVGTRPLEKALVCACTHHA